MKVLRLYRRLTRKRVVPRENELFESSNTIQKRVNVMQWKICFSLPIPWNACYPAPNTHVTVNVIVIRHDSFISKAKTVTRYPWSGIQRENVMTTQKRVMHCRKRLVKHRKLVVQRKNFLSNAKMCFPVSKTCYHLSNEKHIIVILQMCYPTAKICIQNAVVLSNAKTCFPSPTRKLCLWTRNCLFQYRKRV